MVVVYRYMGFDQFLNSHVHYVKPQKNAIKPNNKVYKVHGKEILLTFILVLHSQLFPLYYSYYCVKTIVFHVCKIFSISYLHWS
jgi:hypothetical protein